ncbi:Lcl C-terminal domain-containing protein [Alteromonas gilva]|uniref:DUF1566 domain-containing protein n=1 Tax=Alteromonas gilva TaxID=2987522 RepID=A0ABT5KY86_9ALTE|nr:DUF1566 domain-containing protein [Alteromonas gilva]MDC8829735.1 DUF1566 domain-containing protein [Alteromonas gilva]
MKLKLGFLFALLVSGSALAQECLSGAVATTPGDAFVETDNDATILHSTTNLIWQRCAVGQTWDGDTCTGEAQPMTWQQALTYAQQYDSERLEGWRVPNVKELSSLTERNCVRPAINSAVFPATPEDSFWTSTPSYSDPLRAWTVAFFNASHSIKEKQLSVYLRLVKTNLPD